jgi:hypothetical protein
MYCLAVAYAMFGKSGLQSVAAQSIVSLSLRSGSGSGEQPNG